MTNLQNLTISAHPALTRLLVVTAQAWGLPDRQLPAQLFQSLCRAEIKAPQAHSLRWAV